MFRFNNSYLENKRFKKEVEVAWGNLIVEGWMGYLLKEKVKGLKNSFKVWHKEEYGGMESHTEGLSSSEIQSRKENIDEI
jgi:hypothetical protein